jgi:hypothetical protein
MDTKMRIETKADVWTMSATELQDLAALSVSRGWLRAGQGTIVLQNLRALIECARRYRDEELALLENNAYHNHQ